MKIFNLFKRKYTISFVDSKWNPIKRHIKMSTIPRADELIHYENVYYTVINIVYTLNKSEEVLVILEKIITKNEAETPENEGIEKKLKKVVKKLDKTKNI
jgi:nitrogenase subunit NifH